MWRPTPVVKYMNREQLQKAIERTRRQMVEAAKKMEFIEAAQYRDELIKTWKIYCNRQQPTSPLPNVKTYTFNDDERVPIARLAAYDPQGVGNYEGGTIST